MIKLYNSLTRRVEEFQPQKKGEVSMYTCGPTVYSRATIGNFRTYAAADLLHRLFLAEGLRVTYVMNITDVGHLTGDNLGDASVGEDRLEEAAVREEKDIWELARFYTSAFFVDYQALGLLPPDRWPKATEHIPEQIELAKKLEAGGYLYRTSDGIYFDTAKFKNYGKLSTLDEVKEGARVAANPEKKTPRDFAVWKFSRPEDKRQMEWDSPWGKGFPGWHLECSAMSMKYLGPTFDIHAGGEDLRSTHHPNEIAQSEAVTGRSFVRYWTHAAHLLVDGKRMGKSEGNAYTLADIKKQGIEPLALKYLYLTSHYRSQLNFTWDSLRAAGQALNRLKSFILRQSRDEASGEEIAKTENQYTKNFFAALGDDLGSAKALALVWEMLGSGLTEKEKLLTLLRLDEVLGFNLTGVLELKKKNKDKLPAVEELLSERESARAKNDWQTADKLREQIKELGFSVEDTKEGPLLVPRF